MRILNVEGDYFVQSFRQLGHEVLTIGLEPGCDVIPGGVVSTRALWSILDERGFRPDLALWCDLCRPPLVMGLETLPCVTAGYSIDQYVNPWHVPLSAGFDIFLVAQQDYLRLFLDQRLAHHVEWFPLFCDLEQDQDPGLERDIPVSFVGTLNPPLNPLRRPFLKTFQRSAPIFLHQGDYRPVFARSRLVLNQSAVGELNFRLFQAMSCGAALVTEACGNGLDDLFTPGEDLYLYPRGDAATAAALARQALASPRLEAVAKSGQRKTRALHSGLARARRILSLAEALLRAGLPQWRRENAALVREETARSYAMLAYDSELPLPGGLRSSYAEQAVRLSLA